MDTCMLIKAKVLDANIPVV